MSSNQWNRNSGGFNFRPRSRYRHDNSSGRGLYRGRGAPYPYFTTYDNRRESQAHNSVGVNDIEHSILNSLSVSQAKATDDETTTYAVNLQLDPVEMGIEAKSNEWQQEFKGLGAFNHYFGLLSPTDSFGYTLPDIWDGYFHITLAKFTTPLIPERLEEKFGTFDYPFNDLPDISDIVFQTSSLRIISGENRRKELKDIDFIVLVVDSSPEIALFYKKLEPLLEAIKRQTESNDWEPTALDKFHVTIRKYSKIDYNRYDLKQIPIEHFSLQFRCSHLEVRQPREQARKRYRQRTKPNYQWWSGVTEINRKCSGCGAPVRSVKWEGFCFACGKYETIIPLWSTTDKSRHFHST